MAEAPPTPIPEATLRVRALALDTYAWLLAEARACAEREAREHKICHLRIVKGGWSEEAPMQCHGYTSKFRWSWDEKLAP